MKKNVTTAPLMLNRLLTVFAHSRVRAKTLGEFPRTEPFLSYPARVWRLAWMEIG